MKSFRSFLGAVASIALLSVLALAPSARAGDLSYTTLPQQNDSDLIIAHKLAAAPASNLYSNVSTATTTVCKSGSGVLERIIINTGASTSTVTVYDNTAGSGTKIATAATTAQGVLVYGCHFSTGLTIVTSSTADVTVVYR
ncbi:hypothetical protein EV701_123102 [Chthoniobacter flavus]|nr:hypothetical protein [Chthoniobacter flavus]TCO87265.1 hypothetical protein EV701_123102 [Chthoniobacter flavus]